jgi:hypothetical protein
MHKIASPKQYKIRRQRRYRKSACSDGTTPKEAKSLDGAGASV